MFRHPSNSDQVGPDIVFVISGSPTGSNPLGWFGSAGDQTMTYGTLSFPANQETWIWATASGFTDLVWPTTPFYLVPAPTTPPASFPSLQPAVSYTSANFPSDLTATKAAPDPSKPYYLFSNQQGATLFGLGYVQKSANNRTWFESNAPWSTNGGPTVINVTSWLQFTLCTPNAAGTAPRVIATTTVVA